ncbi:hypothetical protein PMSD_00380 [Paenibacillus macquariensis subsp. defensor]|nr:hypothetical protein PMSD_00380 [Paenibacillus macquariensis subsp. defensor]
MTVLHEVIMNYRAEPIINEELFITARKKGKLVHYGDFKVIMTVETNYSRIMIDWPEGKLPLEYRDDGFFQVYFTYNEEEDILEINGEFRGEVFDIIVKLPTKRKW